MNQERRKVLEMIQKGVINVDEADALLNVLGWGETTAVSPTFPALQITSTDWPSLQRTVQVITTFMTQIH